MTIEELASRLGGQLEGGEPSLQLTAVSGIMEAGPGHVTFLANPKYTAKLDRCLASAALVPLTYSGGFPGAKIRVADPSSSFVEVVKIFLPPPIEREPGLHPSALLPEDAQLGEDVTIGAFVVLEPGVIVGDRSVVGAYSYLGHGVSVGRDCLLHPRVTVREHCRIGDRAVIHCGAVIGSDGFGYNFNNGTHEKIPQVGIVEIDDDVEIGANTTIDRARFGRTWIQSGTKIDNLVQIAHNVVIGKHSLVIAQTGIAGSTTLGSNVTLAGQTGIAGHLHLGDRSVVAAQGGVGRNLEPGEMMWGSPAVPMRQRKETVVYQKRLGELFQRVKTLEKNQPVPPETP